MAKSKSKSAFSIKELSLKEAKQEFARRRSRGSKYDAILEKATGLDKGKALIVEGLSYSEVTGLKKRVGDFLGEGWKISSTKVDGDKGLYDVLVHRDK